MLTFKLNKDFVFEMMHARLDDASDKDIGTTHHLPDISYLIFSYYTVCGGKTTRPPHIG